MVEAIFLTIIIAISNLSTLQSDESIIPSLANQLQEPTILSVDVIKNQSIGWFQARIVLNITTDVGINLSYYLTGAGTNAAKVETVNSSIFQLSNSSSEIEILLKTQSIIFPNTFQYHLILYYINATTLNAQNIFEISSGTFTITMGMPLCGIIGLTILCGILVITVRPVRLRKQKISSSSESSYVAQSPASPTSGQQSSMSPVQGGQIQCPECKQYITEGSAFCPECGYHIPRFLRTKE